MTEKTSYQAELLYNRLVKRYRHLKKWASRTGINAYRLYDRDIPEIPLVLDLYDKAVSGSFFSGVEKEESWLPAIKASISDALNLSLDSIFIKERRQMKQRQIKGLQYERISSREIYCNVIEGDLKFRVNLSDYLDTGLFLDSRKKRAFLRGCSEGKRVLNLFSYTCSLSVAAALGGAIQVDSVDLSNTYLDWGKKNFALNSLNAVNSDFNTGRIKRSKYSLIRADVLDFIANSAEKLSPWDIIILDPPSFSNSKKMNSSFDIKRDHEDIINKCLSLLSPSGILLFSSNARGFKLHEENFPDWKIKNLTKSFMDEDFRGRKIPSNYVFSLSS